MRSLELFREAAERYGYIIVSSHDTRSDGPGERTIRALQAIHDDALQRFAVDPRRLYLAGMSGTARVAWVVGRHLPGVAGVIGFAAGTSPEFDLEEEIPFPFFGGAGRVDFNYQEVRTLDARLDRAGVPHRIRHYPGPHGWPPEEVGFEAVEWMELQAMRRGLRPVGEELVAALFEDRLEMAERAESTGDLSRAARRYEELVEDFSSLRDLSRARSRAGELAERQEVREFRQRSAELARLELDYLGKFVEFLEEFRSSDPPLRTGRMVSRLGVSSLRETADGADDPRVARSARRRLEIVFVHMSFYEPRRLAEEDPTRALAALRLAGVVKPDHPRVPLAMARIHARRGDVEGAVESLQRAVDLGVSPAVALDDPALDGIRDDPRFRDLVRTLRSRRGRDSGKV